ncbi:MAG: hypothetical protein NC311_09000 [Muribaculaceae bacterium]|nr:hypothetical protein [Muribaculaceae bacterium]
MKLSDLMAEVTLHPDFDGVVTADDYVLAVGFGSEEEPDDYLVAQEGITEHSGSLTANTAENTYIRSGKQTTKTGTTRAFNVTGDRYCGDAFQDALLSHKIKYGTGQEVIKPYVYFNRITGEGEKGLLSIVVDEDPSGAAGANAGFKATLTARGLPKEYTYTKKPAEPETQE